MRSLESKLDPILHSIMHCQRSQDLVCCFHDSRQHSSSNQHRIAQRDGLRPVSQQQDKSIVWVHIMSIEFFIDTHEL